MKTEVRNMENTIKSYQDLKVYENLYKAMLIVMKEIAPKLPREEKYDLKSQMNRACKAPPALLAEGFAKRYQPRQWKKYLDDALGEAYEMINHLQVCIDVYSNHVDSNKRREAIEIYDFSCRQLYKLRESWQNFHNNK